MTKRIILILMCFSLLGFLLVLNAESPFKYVGAKKCKTCHNTKKIGKQYEIWSQGPHANALKSLSNEASLKYAKENGIKDPAKEAKCLKCHATAAAVDKELIDKQTTLELAEGVSCESCHGPGSHYKTNAIMKNKEKALANGLIEPVEKVCITCHNKENPFYKPFNYKNAAAKIAHPIPGRK
ncbi:MAG: hypothetical protein JXR46_11580 [Calditrichaceae bacterium]|nr:hypothetical protein [Calditrichaceae bacterium]MBN2709676.1 hypothetical protein [Calditrichaceae bacterium]